MNISRDVNFERDELHLNVDLSNFASVKLIARYPNLNAASPRTIKTTLQTRRELAVKDVAGSVIAVLDFDSKRIVEKIRGNLWDLSEEFLY